ncbi:MAG: phosphate starvation-inducible protein PhoH [Actinomycetota bacterium]|jgi:phosphate starvation-inducible PhoH-like protein|nr:phosphate starvation-inducible protein PhoH [Actinomycetota bacterium]
MTTTTQVKILVPGHHDMIQLVGQRDELLKIIEGAFATRILVRGNEIILTGESKETERVSKLFEELINLMERGQILTSEAVGRSIEMIKGDTGSPSDVLGDTVVVTQSGKPIRPKTVGQKGYVDSIRNNTLVFGIGPAGSGKTYLAVAMAIQALKQGQVSRIVLTRPAVEAGERLGFLPGDLAAKIDPYLRPLYDALYEMLDPETFKRYVERGTIEIAPLAFMRGRTLNDSFIILDEAQNTTPEQMKMFLTRLGFGSKAVVTGDVTQIDLPAGARSGLVIIEEVLQNIIGVSFMHLTARDVVRHKLVQEIVEAYRIYSELATKNQAI